MLVLLFMLMLIVVAGWLDSRLNWPRTGHAGQEER